MAIDTLIDGNPTELRTVATWLRQHLAAGLDIAHSSLDYAKRDDGGWDGDAGQAFRSKMADIALLAADLHSAAGNATNGVDAFADALEGALSRTATLRADAVAAGLIVAPTSILAPRVPLSAPAPLPSDATAAEVQGFAYAQSAYGRAVSLGGAYEAAAVQMAAIRSDLALAAENLDDIPADVKTITIPTVDFLLSATISGLTEARAASLGGRSEFLLDSAARLEANTRLPGAALYPEQFYGDLDEAARLRGQAATAVDDAARWARGGRALGWAAGLVLTGFAIKSDMDNGESTAQAITSNTVGLAASIGAGAATGAAVGALVGSVIPGAGTVVGAVAGAAVGTVVGIFTSGAVDSFFENGPDVAAALRNGWNDVADTGAAVWDLGAAGVSAAGDAIGDAADWVGDGLSDGWDAVFG